ncbi:nuclear transport factor 2-like [Bolinopsis microptera]|uniref:nuclear transport factor 2-like n=1 Tax=Bolinopsis microptera TaxID=2820187 RepID=UPI00307AA051
MATSPQDLGKAFSEHYYGAFSKNRAELFQYYHPQAMLTFEGAQVSGRDAISQKLTSLPFQQVQHVVTTVDVQPVPACDGAIIVQILGQLKTDNDPPHGFVQVFTIFPINGNHLIVNDMFRLVLHNA